MDVVYCTWRFCSGIQMDFCIIRFDKYLNGNGISMSTGESREIPKTARQRPVARFPRSCAVEVWWRVLPGHWHDRMIGAEDHP